MSEFRTAPRSLHIHYMDMAAPVFVSTPISMTPRQQLALRLEREGKTQDEIAAELQIKHQPQVSRLLSRARKAQAAIVQSAQRFIEHGALTRH